MSKRRHNFGTKRFKEKSLFIFHARIALKSLILLFVRLIARGAGIGKTHTHTHTHRQTDRQTKYCNPLAHARRGLITRPSGLMIYSSNIPHGRDITNTYNLLITFLYIKTFSIKHPIYSNNIISLVQLIVDNILYLSIFHSGRYHISGIEYVCQKDTRLRVFTACAKFLRALTAHLKPDIPYFFD